MLNCYCQNIVVLIVPVLVLGHCRTDELCFQHRVRSFFFVKSLNAGLTTKYMNGLIQDDRKHVAQATSSNASRVGIIGITEIK